MGEWRNLKLRDVGQITTGKTPPTSDSSNYGGETPFVTPSDMDGQRTIISTGRTITQQGLKTVGSSFVKSPAIVVSCIGSDMGKAALVNRPFLSNQQINSVITSPDFDRLFVFYNLSMRKNEIRHKASGAAQPIMNKSDFGNLTLDIPDLPEQQAIAAVLSALDDKIELNRRTNETLEASARALFRDWFVDFGPTRAKMEGRPAYLAADLWSLFPDRLDDDGKPEGWEWGSLLDQANWVNGAAYKNMDFVEQTEGLPVVKIAELKAGVTGQTKFTNTDLGDRYRIADGELLFSWSGNPETSIDAFIWTGGPAWLNQHIFAVRENGERSKAELFVLLKWLMPQFAEIARNKQTTGLGHVTKEDMKRLNVISPSMMIRKRFDDLIAPIFERIFSNITDSRTLAETRDLLLPKLMSGEIRVRA